MALPDNRIILAASKTDFSVFGVTGQPIDEYPSPGPARFDHMREVILGLLAHQASDTEPLQFRLGSVWFDLNTKTFRYRADSNAVVSTAGESWESMSNAIELQPGLNLQQWFAQISGSSVGQSFTAGDSITVGDVVIQSITDDTVTLADASDISTADSVVGVATTTAASGADVTILSGGLVTVTAQSGVTIKAGDKIYLSLSSGFVTNVEPSLTGQVSYVLGFAKNGTSTPGGSFTMAWRPRTPEVIA